MRVFNNHTPAVAETRTLPFTGLGFDTTSVQAVAQIMTPQFCPPGNAEPCLYGLDNVSQPSGYKLLVTLGREIRGR